MKLKQRKEIKKFKQNAEKEKKVEIEDTGETSDANKNEFEYAPIISILSSSTGTATATTTSSNYFLAASSMETPLSTSRPLVESNPSNVTENDNDTKGGLSEEDMK